MAVAPSGLTRTDFVLQPVRSADQALLVEQTWQTVSPERFDRFQQLLDAPPNPSERLQRTMNVPRPWQA